MNQKEEEEKLPSSSALIHNSSNEMTYKHPEFIQSKEIELTDAASGGLAAVERRERGADFGVRDAQRSAFAFCGAPAVGGAVHSASTLSAITGGTQYRGLNAIMELSAVGLAPALANTTNRETGDRQDFEDFFAKDFNGMNVGRVSEA